MTNRKSAPVSTWLVMLVGAEVEGGLDALQSHLSPVCDSLQLHSVAAVLLKPLQIHPALRLRKTQNTCWHFYVTTQSLEAPFKAPSLSQTQFQLGSVPANRGLWESPTYWEHMWSWGRYRGEEIAFRALWGSRVIRASQGFLVVFDLQHSTSSVSLMSSCYWLCVFWHSSTSRLLSKPWGAKVETSSTCVNRCLVSPTSISCVLHLLFISSTNSGEDSIEVCVDRLDYLSLCSSL